MLIDTHAHVNFSVYRLDADEVIRRSLDNNTWLINVGSQYSTGKRAVELAEKYKEGVFAAVGLHPIHVSEQGEGLRREHNSLRAQDGFGYEKYKQLARSPGVVAIGEIGLDYKEEYVPFKEKQKKVFLEQLRLAEELHLPIIFHCRMAHDDLINILNSQFLIHNSKLQGVVHCFTGNWSQAEKYLAMGFYLGFNGIIFKMSLGDIIKKTSLDKILIETDCPYLVPPSTGAERNEPIYVRYIAEKIAKIKKITYEEITKITTENAKSLFKI